MPDDWAVRVSFLPGNWRAVADETGALQGWRTATAGEHLWRPLLRHQGCRHSLRETGVRARQAHVAAVAAVALLKRLRKSRDWLHALCGAGGREQGIAVAPPGRFPVRACDAPPVKEPGKPGTLWQGHSSVRLPSLPGAFFALPAPPGPRAGASLPRFPIHPGAPSLAARGASPADGMGYVAAAGGRIIGRVNTGARAFCISAEEPFALLAAVTTLKRAGTVQAWRVKTVGVSQGVETGPATQAGTAPLRRVRPRVPPVPRVLCRRGDAGVGPGSRAGRADLQALHVAGAVGASPQTR